MEISEVRKDPLTELLNKVVAICETLGRGSRSELARFLGVHPNLLTSWTSTRTVEPRGRVVLKMQEWAALKTLEISKQKFDEAYRHEFKVVCRKFPLARKRK
jgi:hypothetical protein